MLRGTLLKQALVLSLGLGLAACGGGGGGGSSSGSSSTSTATGPTAAILASSPVTVTTGNALQVAAGALVQLSGASSSDFSSTITSYSWTLNSKPGGSSASLSASNQVKVSLTPDVTGSYSLTLTVTDAAGLSSSETVSMVVTSFVPAASITDTINFSGPSTTLAAQNVYTSNLINLDASGSTDPGNSTLSYAWTLLQAPSGSTATLSISGSTAQFTPDVAGQYQIRVRATNSSGAYSDVIAVFNASTNVNAPTAVVSANAAATPAGSNPNPIQASTSTVVLLNASQSSIYGSDKGTASWSVISAPSGSTAKVSSTGIATASFQPDLAGSYVVQLVLTDTTNGSTASYDTTIQVVQAPVVVVSGSSTPVAEASAPTFVSSTGVAVTLRGSGSYEPNGSIASYDWQLLSAPAGSTASIATPADPVISFTPDVDGAYVFSLTVTDSNGVSSSQSVTMDVGSYPPVVVLGQTSISTTLGSTVTDSAANSTDPAGKALSYSWSIDARPAGSTAVIVTPNSPTLTFTPDVAGSYTATVTVSDGTFSSVASVPITVN